jgi:glycosyltransferase involved in cell wall biosynthesis
MINQHYTIPLKIVHVITRMILGGAQENTLLTVEGLAAQPQRYEVVLLTGPTVGREGELLERLNLNHIDWRLVPHLTREISPWQEILGFWELVAFFRRIRPDIVHTHSSKAGILGRLAAWYCHVPVVIHTIHGLPFHSYQNFVLNRVYITLEKLCARLSDRIITVADAMKRQAMQAGVANESKFVTVYSGMEVGPFIREMNSDDLRQQLGLQANDIVLGVIARLAPLKGHDYLFHIAPEIVSRYPAVKFLFVGDGSLYQELQRQTDNMQLRKHMIFAGLVAPEMIPRYIRVMDCCIHPSLREGLARVLPQAILCDKPVISFDIDGAKEVVVPGRTGYLVPPGDERILLQTILGWLESRRLPDPFSASEKAQFIAQFRAENMVARIEEVYQESLAEKQCRKTRT